MRANWLFSFKFSFDFRHQIRKGTVFLMKKFPKQSSNSGTWNDLLWNSHTALKTWLILELVKMRLLNGYKRKWLFHCSTDQKMDEVSVHMMYQTLKSIWTHKTGAAICTEEVICDIIVRCHPRQIKCVIQQGCRVFVRRVDIKKIPINTYSYAWSRSITGIQTLLWFVFMIVVFKGSILLLVNRWDIRYGINRETINVHFNKPNVRYSVKRVTFHWRCLKFNRKGGMLNSESNVLLDMFINTMSYKLNLKIYVKLHKLLYINKLRHFPCWFCLY